MRVKSSFFSSDFGEIEIYTLINDNKMEIEILSLGAVVRKIVTPDRKGNFENVVLGLENLVEYFNNSSYFGAIPGRTSGRIGGANATIDGKKYFFDKNDGDNNLHGGKDGLFHKLWKGRIVNNENSVGVLLTYDGEDGEEGFPGNIHIEVYYELDDDNKLSITYRGTTDKTTLLNLTNHSYFNLSGDCRENILRHKLIINSDEFCEIDKDSIVTGKMLSVKDTPFDFKSEKEIGRDINKTGDNQIKFGKGYDHPYILSKDSLPSVVLQDERSGRGMEIHTDATSMVFYTMNYTDNEKLCNGQNAHEHMACCFETQAPPIGYNDEFIEKSILYKDQEYKTNTVYRFYTF